MYVWEDRIRERELKWRTSGTPHPLPGAQRPRLPGEGLNPLSVLRVKGRGIHRGVSWEAKHEAGERYRGAAPRGGPALVLAGRGQRGTRCVAALGPTAPARVRKESRWVWAPAGGARARCEGLRAGAPTPYRR